MNTLGHHTTGDADDAPPVVLLHGLGSAARTWAGCQQSWLPRRTIALDLPGHGASPRRRASYSFAAMAEEVLAFLSDVPVFDLVGHSMGGAVAQFVTMRAPDRVRRLVIEDAPPPPFEPVELWEMPAEPPDPVDFDWAVVDPIFREVRTPNPDWWARLADVTVPALWLAGGPDSHVDQDRIALAAARTPAGRVVEIPAGHHIHREAPAEFTTAVLPFLR